MKTLLGILFISTMIAVNIKAQEGGQCNDKTKTFEVTLKDVSGFHLVYYEFKGPYEESFDDFMGLMEYLGTNNIQMGPNAVGLFYDDPQKVAPENLRSEVGFMVTGPVETSGKYNYKKIDDFKAVSVRYYSMEDIMKAYEALGEYIAEYDITPKGPSIEIYYSSDPAKVDTEILMPIEK